MSKIIKQVLEYMMDRTVSLMHQKIFTIALELRTRYVWKLLQHTTKTSNKMLNKARSAPEKKEKQAKDVKEVADVEV